MRIFLAGATGVIGIRLVPLLIAAGHEVTGMTRSKPKVADLQRLGADPIVCDVYDLDALREAVTASHADAVMHQLTDLPDDPDQIRALGARNDRMRSEGTQNLLDASAAAGVERFLGQSIAWTLPPERQRTVSAHEKAILDAGGVVLRYGQLYGPGTYYESTPPPPPRIEVGAAAERTVELLDAPSGIATLLDAG
jgi:nucleoside-diphosphate-sugar epimerase